NRLAGSRESRGLGRVSLRRRIITPPLAAPRRPDSSQGPDRAPDFRPMKTQRHAAILRIVRGETVGSQEQLRERLKAEGYNVTQATLSRDIRELGLAKVAAPDGGSHYAAGPDGAPGGGVRPHLEQLLPTMLVSAEGVGPLLVLKATTGGAQALGLALDGASTVGWRGWQMDSMPSGWGVREGALTRVRPAADIITTEKFRNFELSLEWNVAPKGNSGIFYRASEDDDAIYWTAPEMQVLDDAGHPDGQSRLTAAGADYGLYPSPAG